jgi:DUF2917 family protein
MIVELNEAKAWSAQVPRAGVEIRVLTGTVWVTQEGDAEDHVLSAGGTFVADRAGRVGIQAFTHADVAVEVPNRHPAPLHAAAA